LLEFVPATSFRTVTYDKFIAFDMRMLESAPSTAVSLKIGTTDNGIGFSLNF